MTPVRPTAAHDPFRSSLLGHASGDALGAPAEFLERSEVARRFGRLAEMVGGGSFGWAPGEWTDDTAMMLAVADGLLAAPDDPLPEIGRRFLAWEPTAKAVGAPIRDALHSYADSWPAAAQRAAARRAGHTAGNGSLMRTLPVALAIPERIAVQRVAARVSAMTHWASEAETCCAVFCLWIREALRGRELGRAWQKALDKARIDAARGPLAPDTAGPVSPDSPLWDRLASAGERRADEIRSTGYVVDTLEAAAWCCLGNPTAEAAIVAAANLGGDADTVAAVTGGAAGAFRGDPPPRWLAALSEHPRLEELGSRLRQLRHDLVYGSWGMPAFSVVAVDDRLLVGRNPLTELDVLALAERGVAHVVDLREKNEYGAAERHGQEAVAALERHGIDRLHLPIPDGGAPSDEDFDCAWTYLRSATQGDGDGRVLIHCRAGIERTGAILLAYWARERLSSIAAAARDLAERGVPIRPMSHQIAAAERWLAQPRGA